MISEKEEEASVPQRLSCTTCFDALWFCYSPVHQMQQYYRLGVLDNCSGKWNALVDCLTLKTKRTSVVEALAVFFVVALFSATASAQEAPAAVPGMDVGSAFALPISAAVVCSSVLLSLFTLFA
ncbi:hypothetical protein CsSME_00040557 [Camellia sinensis var. sinensis]